MKKQIIIPDKQSGQVKGGHFLSFIYLHGEAEEKNGYDCCLAKDRSNFIDTGDTYTDSDKHIYRWKEGIHECEIHFHDGDILDANAYIWKDKLESFNRSHGLIVLTTDVEANEYALESYNLKKDHI